MAEDLNRVVVVGRLVRDAELQYTTSGWAILKMSIATNRRKKQGDQWVDEANFFDVSLFGKRGESLQQYLSKGTQVAVSGALKQDRWQQDGVNRSKVSIEADNIQLIGGRRDSQQQGAGPGSSSNSQPFESYNPGNGQGERFEDDIPF